VGVPRKTKGGPGAGGYLGYGEVVICLFRHEDDESDDGEAWLHVAS
jgi:hypothetical protein